MLFQIQYVLITSPVIEANNIDQFKYTCKQCGPISECSFEQEASKTFRQTTKREDN